MQKANKHTKKMFSIIGRGEMPIEIMMGYHYAPVRGAKIKKKIVTISNAGKAVEKVHLSYIVGKNVK